MWRLIKSEIEYFKWLFILSLSLVLIINIALTIDNRWIEAQGDFPGLRVIWFGVGIVVLFFTILFNRKSGRLRTKNVLPISNVKIGVARWISFFVFWILLLIILIVFYLINNNGSLGSNWFANLISITGTIIFINSIPILYSDFINTYFKTWEKLIVGILWTMFFLLYISLNVIFSTYLDFIAPGFISSSRQIITNLYYTNTITFASIFGGGIMFLATIYTFKKRKLYLE